MYLEKETLKRKPIILLLFFWLTLNFYISSTLKAVVNPDSITWNNVRIAQGPTPVISCDVKNGDSFQSNNISSINWTISGYQSDLYILKDNGNEDFFGTILGNNSFKIQQDISNLQGWHSFSIHIFSGGTQISESYVVIEINVPENPWIINLPWILASVAVVSSTILNIYLTKRKDQGSGRGEKQKRLFPRQRRQVKQYLKTNVSFETYPARSDVIVTSNAEEGEEWDLISTTRIEKIWIITPNMDPQIHSELYRPDRISPSRETTLDTDILSAIQKMGSTNILSEPLIVNIPGLEDSERLLILQLRSNIFCLILFSGRISRNFLRNIVINLNNLPGEIFKIKDGKLLDFQEFLESPLHLTRSYSYVKSGPETDSVVERSGAFTSMQDQSVWEDVPNLTFSECEEIIRTIQTKTNNNEQDPYYDDAEVLPRDD